MMWFFTSHVPFEWYQTADSYVQTGWMTALYICLTFWKLAPHIDIDSFDSVSVYVIIFASIFLMWAPHHSFEFTWTPRIRTDVLECILRSSRLSDAFMSNHFEVLVRCISSYFTGVKCALCVWAHCSHSLCITFSFLQLFAVLSPYISMLTSFMNSTELIPFLSCVHALISSELKNRNRIDDIEEPCGISVFMLNSDNSYPDSWIVIFLSVMKLWTQSIRYLEMALTLRLCISLSILTLSKASSWFRHSIVMTLCVLCFQIVCTCSVISCSAVSVDQPFLTLIWMSESSMCLSARSLSLDAMMAFSTLPVVFRSAIGLYAPDFM